MATMQKLLLNVGLVVIATSFAGVRSWVIKPSTKDATRQLQARSVSSLTLKATIANNDFTQLGTLRVPSIGIGTISWSSQNVFGLENDELQKIVATACAQDAAFFDSAERYGSHMKTALGMGWGETERLTRALIDRVQSSSSSRSATAPPLQQQQQPVIATKFTPSPWRTTMESVVAACEQSRQRLGVDQIDLYQLHMPDIVQPFRKFGKFESKDAIYWNGLAECYHRGLVKNVGVSNYGPTLLAQCQEALDRRGVPLVSNQIAYSLIGRRNGAQDTLEKCNDLGIKVLAYFPFAMGVLTGKYSTSAPQDNLTGLANRLPTLMANQKTRLELLDLKRYALGDGNLVPHGGVSPLLFIMEQVAAKRGKTVAQVALNYIVCKGAIPIPGARTQEQLVDNIGAMGWRLTDQEVRVLETAADSLGFGFEGAGFKRTSEKFVGYGVEKWALD